VTTPTEHEAVLESVEYLRRLHRVQVTELPSDADGLVDPSAFARRLRSDTISASVAHANNELGTGSSRSRSSRDRARRRSPFHTDAVVGGWLEVGLTQLGLDALSVTGHKLGAPKGIGVLAVRGAIPLERAHGGGQERRHAVRHRECGRHRGLAEAFRLAAAPSGRGCRPGLRDALIDGVLASVPSALLIGSRTRRLPNHAAFAFPGTSGEAVLARLEQRGSSASSGSACAAGSDEPSHALLAIAWIRMSRAPRCASPGVERREASRDEAASRTLCACSATSPVEPRQVVILSADAVAGGAAAGGRAAVDHAGGISHGTPSRHSSCQPSLVEAAVLVRAHQGAFSRLVCLISAQGSR